MRPASTSPTARGPARPIYVVDDDAAVRDSLQLLLEAHERSVRSFASAVDFLTVADRVPAGCLVLDYAMPCMNGLELMNELRHRGLTMPTVLITGVCDSRLQRRAASSEGIVGFLEKPFPDASLLALVGRALADSTPAPTAIRDNP